MLSSDQIRVRLSKGMSVHTDPLCIYLTRSELSSDLCKQVADGWDLVQEDYGERDIMSRVPRDSFKGISIIPRRAPGQVIRPRP